MIVWIVFANDVSDEGIVCVCFSYQDALKEADSYRLRYGLDKEDVWVDSYNVK